jgi:UDP:flavonoid glycosyltransferase YjiC (YdhE family)
MSRFLFVMWEGGGTVPPELAIARRLIARGHAVYVLGDPTIEAGAKAIGASYSSWRDAPHVRSLQPQDALVKNWEIRNPLTLLHCGHGTTLKALSHGTPLLCLPMGRDQVDNAARTVWHGAGIRLKRSASVPEITRSLETLLGNDRYATQARALAERLRREGERDSAVEELEALAVKRV